VTQPSWMWRCLAVAAALSCLGVLVEVLARFALTSLITPRRSWGLWILTSVCLGLAAPAAVSQLKSGPTARVRQAVVAGFGCFDVLVALAVWRWRAGGGDESLGSPVVLMALVVVAGALVLAAVRSHRDLLDDGPSGTVAR